jgi:hypothetical protein
MIDAEILSPNRKNKVWQGCKQGVRSADQNINVKLTIILVNLWYIAL